MENVLVMLHRCLIDNEKVQSSFIFFIIADSY